MSSLDADVNKKRVGNRWILAYAWMTEVVNRGAKSYAPLNISKPSASSDGGASTTNTRFGASQSAAGK